MAEIAVDHFPDGCIMRPVAKDPEEDRWITTGDACERTGLKYDTLMAKARRGEIGRRRFGTLWQIDSWTLAGVKVRKYNRKTTETPPEE